MIKVLILEDKETDLKLILDELKLFNDPHQIKTTKTKSGFEKLLVEFKPNVVLSDYSLPDYNGLQAFNFCKSLNYEGVFIVLSDTLLEETLVEFLQEGMDDYIQKPHLKRLPGAIKNALERIELHHLKDKHIIKLEEQDKLLTDLFDSCFEATMITKEGIVLNINPTFTNLFGFTKTDLIGKSVFAYCHPEYLEIAKHHMLNNSREHYQLKFYDKSNQLVTTEVLGRPIMLDGEVHRLTSFRDCTKIEAMESELSAKQQSLVRQQKVLLELVRDNHANVENSIRKILSAGGMLLNVERVSLWMYNPERTWIQCRLLYKLSENKFDAGPVILKEDNPVYFNFIEEHRFIAAHDAQKDERTIEFTETYLKANNISSMLDIPIWVHGLHKGIICYEHTGKVRQWTDDEIKLAANLADIMAGALCAEEQERTLKRLLKSEIRLSESQKIAGVGDWEYDIDSKTLICSPETYRIHEREPKITRLSLYEYTLLIHPDDRNAFNQAIDRIVETQTNQRLEYRILLLDGKTKYVHTNIKALKQNGEIKLYGTLLDMKEKEVVFRM